jgi:hypothetical protein
METQHQYSTFDEELEWPWEDFKGVFSSAEKTSVINAVSRYCEHDIYCIFSS